MYDPASAIQGKDAVFAAHPENAAVKALADLATALDQWARAAASVLREHESRLVDLANALRGQDEKVEQFSRAASTRDEEIAALARAAAVRSDGHASRIERLGDSVEAWLNEITTMATAVAERVKRQEDRFDRLTARDVEAPKFLRDSLNPSNQDRAVFTRSESDEE